jgi:hypothetical protein
MGNRRIAFKLLLTLSVCGVWTVPTVFAQVKVPKVLLKPAFKVTEVFLKADDAKPAGSCPITVNFHGTITANGPGTVTYAFLRSDAALSPTYALRFEQAGTKEVSTTWTLGKSYEGWVTIRVSAPNEIESSREAGSFVLTCRAEASQAGLRAAVSALGHFIRCPVEEVRTEITTPLPSPWWNTPQIGGVEETAVETIGGKQTLVCKYRAYGRTVPVMREMPQGVICTPATGGFNCHRETVGK